MVFRFDSWCVGGWCRRSVAELFRIHVVTAPAVCSPLNVVNNVCFFHVRHENVYVVVCSSLSSALPNASATPRGHGEDPACGELVSVPKGPSSNHFQRGCIDAERTKAIKWLSFAYHVACGGCLRHVFLSNLRHVTITSMSLL